MSELVDPIVTLEFYEISHRGRKLPEEAREFSAFLKRYIARWAGEAGILCAISEARRFCGSCVSNGIHPFAFIYCVRLSLRFLRART